MNAITFAISAMTVIPDLVKAGIDIVAFVKETNAALEKMQTEDRDPNDSEWQALNKVVEDLRAQRPDV